MSQNPSSIDITRLDSVIEDALWTATKSRLGAAVTKHKNLLKAIELRSALYTTEREQFLGDRLVNSLVNSLGDGSPRENAEKKYGPSDLAARAVFFTVADASKIKLPLAELLALDCFSKRNPLRVLDIGAGCGAMTFGLMDAMPELAMDVVAIDRDRDALAIFSSAVGILERMDVALEIRVGSVESAALVGDIDLAFLGSVLNELDEQAAIRLVESVVGQLSATGSLIIIEPALRESSRRLHRLRDHLLDKGSACRVPVHVFAPCTRAMAPCPALELERDWCHEDRPFSPPPRFASLASVTGLRRSRLKFSYLVLRRCQGNVANGQDLLRVVSSLNKTKGKSELVACGPSGWQKLRLQKRDRTDDNRIFGRARRGDLISMKDGVTQLFDSTIAGDAD